VRNHRVAAPLDNSGLRGQRGLGGLRSGVMVINNGIGAIIQWH
jgi:hypothetical protein